MKNKTTRHDMNHKTMTHNTKHLLRAAILLAALLLCPTVWGQTLPFEVTTADDTTNHTEKFYWIESAGATGFYAVPHSDNSKASTTNAPTLRALWYFMASDEDGYYYIINKETGKYLKKTGNTGSDNTIGVADYATTDDAKFKFSFSTPTGIIEGYWVIYPKEAGTAGWLSKKSGNTRYDLWLKVSNWNNTPVGDANSQWKIVAKDGVQWPQSGLPFVVSTSSEKHYYRINHAQSTNYNISYDANNNVTISTEYDNNTAWYFEEAATDPNIDNLKYYYIVNASSGKYLKFTATTIDGSNQDDKFILSDYNSQDPDSFQFVVVNSYVATRYSIMPKLAMSKYDVNKYANSMVPSSVTNNQKLDLRSDRNNANAHWIFVTTEYPMSCTISSITYDSSTGKITITRSPSNADIHYTTDGTTEPTSSDGTPYSAPFDVSGPITIKAIATKDGYVNSEVTTKSFDQVAAPSIQDNGLNAISITCATAGATIHYTTDGSTPTTTSPVYSSPLTENVSGVTINAIAVKEGLINSVVTSASVMLQCAKPIIARIGDNATINCSFPSSGVSIYYTKNGGAPSSSSTLYSGNISVTTGDVIRAIAIASGYTSSEVAEKTIHDELTPTGGVYYINNDADFESFVEMANEDDGLSYHYKLTANVNASTAIAHPFTGIFDGAGYTITGLTHPLFNTVDGGVVKNVMLKGVSISSSEAYVGAIAGIAQGYSRIYNCGILPNDNTFPGGTHPNVSTSGSCAGGIVGKLDGDSRVINCFSYADVSATTTAAGIVGQNMYASTAAVTEGKYANLRTAVVNCMFYGNITGGTNQYGVYGGQLITNAATTGISSYNYFRNGSQFTAANGHPNTKGGANVVGNPTAYNCSFPADERYLTQVEFLRSLLNSNRELCGWWVGSDVAPSTMSTTDVQAIPKDASLMYKWVVDPNLAPYPILKPFGKYPSVVNGNTGTPWFNRSTANPYEGKQLGTLSVTVKSGTHSSAANQTLTLPITDMDTLHYDFGYRKVQLPYFNSIFGNPNGADWTAKYAGNYTDSVVTGWKVTAVTGGTQGTYLADWQNGYNFADRKCTDKDKYDVSGRVFAQGGNYYVPDGVSAITIEAYWGKAIYVRNDGNSYDRVNITEGTTGTHFAPAGTRTALGNAETVYTTKIRDVIDNITVDKSIYDHAIVLVGNVQESNGDNAVTVNSGDTRGFTIMSVDLDFDEEPDYCLEWQLGTGTKRNTISPVRFDFLPVVELGIAYKLHNSTNFFSLGCFRSKGHFEVTETAFIRFGQFEFETKNRNEGPIILNGGIFDQYTRGTMGNDNTNNVQHITYVILGGHIVMPSFTPGAHVNGNANYATRHCAVNALGGDFTSFYLTGGYNENVDPNADSAKCYIDGGRFGTIAAAYKEGIKGNVVWRINHALIREFYGGGMMSDANKVVKGNIDVVIDSSIVSKYCGGPKFGDMVSGKTVTTRATGTVFTEYYGAGNGGTNYVQFANDDKTDGPRNASQWYTLLTSSGKGKYAPRKYISTAKCYHANYDYEEINPSTGTTTSGSIDRIYYYSAQFATTNTGDITSILTGCTVEKNFYGAGFLGGVNGTVTSTLDNTRVMGSAFGAGYSASVPKVSIYNTDKTPPVANTYTGLVKPQSGGTYTTYTWCDTSGTIGSPVTHDTLFFTEISLSNLGAVSQTATITIKGNSEIGTMEDDGEGHQVLKANTGNVYGGGDESAVAGNTTVILQGKVQVLGNVYGGGNKGPVAGNSEVKIQD